MSVDRIFGDVKDRAGAMGFSVPTSNDADGGEQSCTNDGDGK